jgi:transposase-like protein
MNAHRIARLTYARRMELVKDITERGLSCYAAAMAHGVTAPTARRWLGRYLAQGAAGLADRCSRPALSPRAIAPGKALAIVELRRKRPDAGPDCLGQGGLQQHRESGFAACRPVARPFC